MSHCPHIQIKELDMQSHCDTQEILRTGREICCSAVPATDVWVLQLVHSLLVKVVKVGVSQCLLGLVDTRNDRPQLARDWCLAKTKQLAELNFMHFTITTCLPGTADIS